MRNAPASVMGGGMPVRRLASMDLPVPGGPKKVSCVRLLFAVPLLLSVGPGVCTAAVRVVISKETPWGVSIDRRIYLLIQVHAAANDVLLSVAAIGQFEICGFVGLFFGLGV